MIEVVAVSEAKGEVRIYDQIGSGFFTDGVTSKQFAKDIKALGDVSQIDVRINSPGGSVFEGLAIFNELDRHDATINVFVDGTALSMASAVAMAGDTITMADNALMMIHNPRAGVVGESKDMRRIADMVDKSKESLIKAYAGKTGKDKNEISALMDAETWMTAEEAFELGFVDAVGEEVELVATFTIPEDFRVPNHLCAHVSALFGSATDSNDRVTETEKKESANMSDTQTAEPVATTPATLGEIKAACPGADADFVIAQLEVNATVAAAQKAFIAKQQSDVEAAKKEAAEAAEAKAKAEQEAAEAKQQAAEKIPGNDPVSGTGDEPETAPNGNAREEWLDKVNALVDQGIDRQQATFTVNRKYPELREQMLEAFESNPKKDLYV